MFNLTDLQQRINQTCRGCGNKYHLVKNILEHVKGVDCEYRNLFQCALCPHSSKRKYNLKMHIYTRHSKSHGEHSNWV